LLGQPKREIGDEHPRTGAVFGVDEGSPRVILVPCGEIWVKVGAASVLYTGTYRRSLDDKLRLPIPKPLRTSEAAGRFYLTPGLDHCLALYPEPAFEALAERLASASPAAREVRDYSRVFFSQAVCVAPDGQWRFRVPAELAKWAELGAEVVLVGVRDHLEIWRLELWEQYIARCDSQHDRLAEIAFVGSTSASPSSVRSIPSPAQAEPATPSQPR
jgi:MraZ protein